MLEGPNRLQRGIPRFQELYWLPFPPFCVKFKVLVIIYKVLIGLGPGCLEDCLILHSPARTFRSSWEGLFQVPPLAEARSVVTRERVFSVLAPQFWNSLPKESHLAPMFRAFKKNLKIELRMRAFNTTF